MPRWILVRHGESTANAADTLAGHLDAPLTALGRAQAQALAPVLDPIPIERVFTSTLSRAADTARLAVGHRGLPFEATPALRERHMGAWEGASRSTLRQGGQFERVLLSWSVRAPGGESNQEAALRALTWLAAHADATPNHAAATLLVAHGGILRSLLGLLDDRPIASFLTDSVPNAHPVSRLLDPGDWARARRRAAG